MCSTQEQAEEMVLSQDCLIYDEEDQLIAKAKGVFFNNS
jgi:hypothetical protein